MPVVDRPCSGCPAAPVTDAAVADALREVAEEIASLVDVIETGLGNICATLRQEEV